MIWLTWRQYRVQTLVALGALAVITGVLMITGFRMRSWYDTNVAGCGNDCGSAENAFINEYSTLAFFATGLLIAVPGLIGIFWGAPLIARELETGTHRLIWNQSITRTRWLAVKLAAVGLAAVTITGLLSLLVTWWAQPVDRVNTDRFTPLLFDGRGVVPLGYAAFAFAVGACAGLLIRRTVPAMAATLAVFIAVQVLMPFLIRPHLMTPERENVAMSSVGMVSIGSNDKPDAEKGEWNATNIHLSGDGDAAYVRVGMSKPGAWVVSDLARVRDAAGRTVSGAEGCAKVEIEPMKCFATSDLHVEVSYHPADRYWLFQWIETVIFLVLAGSLSGFCFWWLRRRTV